MIPAAPNTVYLSNVNDEYGRPWNTAITLNDSLCRTLAQIPSGYITMDNLRGKSSYTPMSASGVSDVGGSYQSSASPGTAVASPSVRVSGGSGGYTFKWTIVSNMSLVPTLANDTLQTCKLSRVYSRNSNGSFDSYLQCVITDNTQHSITVTNIEGGASWGTPV